MAKKKAPDKEKAPTGVNKTQAIKDYVRAMLVSQRANPIHSENVVMAKKKAAVQETAPAAVVNKSQAIRDYAKANPTAGPTAIVAALAEQGIQVTTAMASTVKSIAKKKRRAKRAAAAGAKPASDKISVAALIQAKKAAAEMGGIEKAKEALAALAKLQ